MCGIIGYIGDGSSPKHLVEGLYALEYRGYDSAGIAAFDDENKLTVVKAKGRLCNVEEKIATHDELVHSHCGIGHTRWATHGEPSDVNSHPHGGKLLQIVHNGIIENYMELKAELIGEGYKFASETDTEVAAMLLERNYKLTGDHVAAIRKSTNEILGSYAFAIVFADEPNKIFATKKDSPLIVGCGDGENFVASDITAILRYTNRYYQLEEGELAIVERDAINLYDRAGEPIHKEQKVADWNIEEAERGGYPHFMIKEINEEPKAIEKTLRPRIKNGLPDFGDENIDVSIFKNINRIYIVACGTAMYAGLIGKSMFESFAKIPCSVEIASEFRYNDPLIGKGDLVMIISQSGETADSLAALRLAKEKGATTLAVVNVMGSSIARDADFVLYTWAGPEIAVASTKAYTVQSALLTLLALEAAFLRGTLTEKETKWYVTELADRAPVAIGEVIAEKDKIEELAQNFIETDDLFFIGRGIDYCLAMEGSLKLKEITYIHSEAYAAGELKHGTISLIVDDMPVIALATVDRLYDKMLSNIKEVKARGAKILTICKGNAANAAAESDFVLHLPEIDEKFAVLPAATVLQLLAYYTAVARGCDVDKPRNLAKSVTVE